MVGNERTDGLVKKGFKPELHETEAQLKVSMQKARQKTLMSCFRVLACFCKEPSSQTNVALVR